MTFDVLLRPFVRMSARCYHAMWRARAMTLGVRALVLGPDGVFLVRHTYIAGWYLPGGGVERGESAEAAVIRELREEGGIRCIGRPVLHGLYFDGRRDHVACYVVREFERDPGFRPPAWEIAECHFFSVENMPEGTTRATRSRVAEVLAGDAAADRW